MCLLSEFQCFKVTAASSSSHVYKCRNVSKFHKFPQTLHWSKLWTQGWNNLTWHDKYKRFLDDEQRREFFTRSIQTVNVTSNLNNWVSKAPNHCLNNPFHWFKPSNPCSMSNWCAAHEEPDVSSGFRISGVLPPSLLNSCASKSLEYGNSLCLQNLPATRQPWQVQNSMVR